MCEHTCKVAGSSGEFNLFERAREILQPTLSKSTEETEDLCGS